MYLLRVAGTLLTMTSVGEFQMIPNILAEIVDRIEADVLINVIRHACESIEEVHKVDVNG